MSVVTDLQEARELILKEEYWTQEAYARDAEGDIVSPDSADACQWCVMGALRKVSGYPAHYKSPLERKVVIDRFFALEQVVFTGEYNAVAINDTDGHAATIELLDKLIAKEKGQA